MSQIKKDSEEKVEFEECPYCLSRDIQQDKNGIWTCLFCWQQWDEEGIV